ncbi:hypothetical protein SAMN04489807_3469, partial [Microbacterium hydrocarbonoxydans]
VTYAIVRRRRDFASITQFAADHYEVRVQASSLAKARLALGAATPAPVRAPVNLDEPPRYGERITPGAQPAPTPPAPTPPAPEEPAAGSSPVPAAEPTPPLGVRTLSVGPRRSSAPGRSRRSSDR